MMTKEKKMDTSDEFPGKVAGGADGERHGVLVVAKEGSGATVYKGGPKVEFAIHCHDLFGSSPATGWDCLTNPGAIKSLSALGELFKVDIPGAAPLVNVRCGGGCNDIVTLQC
jgi:hypothetical protein